MQEFRPGGFGSLPEVVKNLLIINGLFYLATIALPAVGIDLVDLLGLYPVQSGLFKPYQLVTHMFMHGGFVHIFFNMFMLWMFGNILERVWGPKRFLTYYLITGLGAAAIHLLVTGIDIWMLEKKLIASGADVAGLKDYLFGKYHSIQEAIYGLRSEGYLLSVKFHADQKLLNELVPKYFIPTVGASGAIYGLLLAFGMMFPNSLIYIYFLFPIKAKYLVILLGAIELYTGIQANPGDNVAHFAHLGGMIFGFILIKLWRSNRY